MPLGIATAVLAGLLLWLGSGNDEPTPMEPEAPAQLADAPEVPAIPAADEPKPEPPAATDSAAPAVAPTLAAEPAAPATTDAAPSASAEPAPSAAAAGSDEAPATPPEPAPSAAPEAAASPGESDPIPSDEGLVEGPVIQVFMAPDCAELYRKGKRVGRSGVRVRVPEGKRRFYEVVCPGHNTRKLTLDGSRKEVSIGLRPIKR